MAVPRKLRFREPRSRLAEGWQELHAEAGAGRKQSVVSPSAGCGVPTEPRALSLIPSGTLSAEVVELDTGTRNEAERIMSRASRSGALRGGVPTGLSAESER